MGRLSLTRPRSFLAFAAGCVLPLSVTRLVSSIRLTMRTAGAACCARATAENRNALASTNRGSERNLFIVDGPGPFLEKDTRIREELPWPAKENQYGPTGVRTADEMEDKSIIRWARAASGTRSSRFRLCGHCAGVRAAELRKCGFERQALEATHPLDET